VTHVDPDRRAEDDIVLSVLAGGAALVLASVVARLLEGTVVLPGVSPLARAAIDWRVAAWGIGLATLAAIIISLSPMWSVRRASVMAVARRPSGSPAGRRLLRIGLVAVQVAASFVLVVGAVLLSRSILSKLSTDPGFDASRVLTFSVQPASANSQAPGALHGRLIDRMRQVPGVRTVSLSFLPPYNTGNEQRLLFRTEAAAEPASIALNSVKPAFFDAVGVRIIDGRDFIAADLEATLPAAQGPLIVTESFARRVFGTAQVAGRTILSGTAGTPRTIVGVVAETRQRRLIGDDAGDIAFQPPRGDTRLPWITVVLGTSAPASSVILPGASRAGGRGSDAADVPRGHRARGIQDGTR